MAASFARFGSAHLCVIALTFVTPLLLAALVRWGDCPVAARIVSSLFVALLVGGKILMLVLLARDGELTIANAAQVTLQHYGDGCSAPRRREITVTLAVRPEGACC